MQFIQVGHIISVQGEEHQIIAVYKLVCVHFRQKLIVGF